MAPTESLDTTQDPVGTLHDILEYAWDTICRAYEVDADMPDLQALFRGADLNRPAQAADTLLVNMLLEVSDCVCRFSPWYKKPARAFGLVQMRGWESERPRWILAPEASQKWRDTLSRLQELMDRHGSLIEAVLLVDSLMSEAPQDEPCVTAACSCFPPRKIRLRPCVLDQAAIVCDVCQQTFRSE